MDYRREREKFVLQIIGENELTIAEIAEKLQTDSGNAWGILHTMETKGILTSRHGKKDNSGHKRSFWKVKT